MEELTAALDALPAAVPPTAALPTWPGDTDQSQLQVAMRGWLCSLRVGDGEAPKFAALVGVDSSSRVLMLPEPRSGAVGATYLDKHVEKYIPGFLMVDVDGAECDGMALASGAGPLRFMAQAGGNTGLTISVRSAGTASRVDGHEPATVSGSPAISSLLHGLWQAWVPRSAAGPVAQPMDVGGTLGQWETQWADAHGVLRQLGTLPRDATVLGSLPPAQAQDLAAVVAALDMLAAKASRLRAALVGAAQEGLELGALKALAIAAGILSTLTAQSIAAVLAEEAQMAVLLGSTPELMGTLIRSHLASLKQGHTCSPGGAERRLGQAELARWVADRAALGAAAAGRLQRAHQERRVQRRRRVAHTAHSLVACSSPCV
jgi:hypothetical protein